MAGVTILSAPAPEIAALFGDGSHPASRLAQAALGAVARGRVLDVGTGTGILCRVALASGASEAVGIDHHPAAVASARALVPGASFRVADAREYLMQVAGGAFDVVVANLPDPPLTELIPELVAAARPAGILIVSGLLLWQADAALAELRAAGAVPEAPQADAGWCAITARC